MVFLPEVVLGLILVIGGILYILKPDIFLKIQVRWQKVIYGAKYIPGQRTRTITRLTGILFLLMGVFFMIAGMLLAI